MAHSDDKGLVLPPKMASLPVVVVPIGQDDKTYPQVEIKAKELAEELTSNLGIKVKIDDRNERPGEKFFHWEKRGVPVRLEIGPKDLEKGSVVLVRRDTGEKMFVKNEEVVSKVKELLETIQTDLYDKAKKFRDENTRNIDSWDEFKNIIEEKGGFIKAHWCESAECEAKVKEETKATIRCIPFDQEKEEGKCIFCGNKSHGRVIFAKAY